MKKYILLLLALCASLISYAQETPPATGMKQLATSTFYLHLPDSAVWHYKGAAYGWERLGKYSDIPTNYITTNTTQISPGITGQKAFRNKVYMLPTLKSSLNGEAPLSIDADFSEQVGSATGFVIDANRNASPSTGTQGIFNFKYNGDPKVRAYNVGGLSAVGGVNVGSSDSLTTPGLKLSYTGTTGLLKIGTDKMVVTATPGVDYISASSVSASTDIKYPADFGFRPFGITEKDGKFYPDKSNADILKYKIPYMRPYYVDYANGSNSNDGASPATPVKTVTYAIVTLGARLLYVAPGIYKNDNWTTISNTLDNDLAIICNGPGKAIFSAADTSTPVWSSEGSGVYSTPLTLINRVVDTKYTNAGGYPQALTKTNSLSAAQALAGSSYIDQVGNVVYVHTNDGRLPDASILLLKRQSNCDYRANSGYLFVQGVTFMGGNTTATGRPRTGAFTGLAWYMYNNCDFIYGGGLGLGITGQGEGYVGTNSNTWMENCTAYSNDRDGFNYLTSGKIIEVNVQSHDNGGLDGTNTVNGSSAHAGINVLRINSKYWNNYGPNVIDVQSDVVSPIQGTALVLGCEAFNSLGSGPPTSIYISNADFAVGDNNNSGLSKMYIVRSKSSNAIAFGSSGSAQGLIVVDPTTVYKGTYTAGVTFGNYTAADLAAMTYAPLSTYNSIIWPTTQGGTGLSSYTAGNYINAATSTTLQQRTPAQVRTDIGAIGLTNLSATSPILYNSTTGVISSQAASETQSGYLDATNTQVIASKYFSDLAHAGDPVYRTYVSGGNVYLSNAGVYLGGNGAGVLQVQSPAYLQMFQGANKYFFGALNQTKLISDETILGEDGTGSTTLKATSLRAASALSYTGATNNRAGTDLILKAGGSTGSSIVGDIVFQTADALVSGNTNQPYSTKMTLNKLGNLGIGGTPTSKLSILNNGLGTTGNLNTTGISLLNSTAATSILSQHSPALLLGGNIWDQNSSTTKDVRFSMAIENAATVSYLNSGLSFNVSGDGGSTWTRRLFLTGTGGGLFGDFSVSGGLTTAAAQAITANVTGNLNVGSPILGSSAALATFNSTSKGIKKPTWTTLQRNTIVGANGSFVQSIMPVNVGSGYTTATVSFTGGGTPSTAAAATAIITGGQVTGFNITSFGEGYTSIPTVVITGDGTGATATAYSTPIGLEGFNRETQRTDNYTSTGWKEVAYTSDLPIIYRATGSGNGTTTITMPHGIAGVSSASSIVLMPRNADAGGFLYASIDSTNIYVHYAAPPPTGTVNLFYDYVIRP